MNHVFIKTLFLLLPLFANLSNAASNKTSNGTETTTTTTTPSPVITTTTLKPSENNVTTNGTVSKTLEAIKKAGKKKRKHGKMMKDSVAVGGSGVDTGSHSNNINDLEDEEYEIPTDEIYEPIVAPITPPKPIYNSYQQPKPPPPPPPPPVNSYNSYNNKYPSNSGYQPSYNNNQKSYSLSYNYKPSSYNSYQPNFHSNYAPPTFNKAPQSNYYNNNNNNNYNRPKSGGGYALSDDQLLRGFFKGRGVNGTKMSRGDDDADYDYNKEKQEVVHSG